MFGDKRERKERRKVKRRNLRNLAEVIRARSEGQQ
jgi:hypothetical protein